MKSIGIDIGKRRCIVCTMDRNGTVLGETGYENTYAAATAFARKARREYGKCQAVCESTGNLWIKTYEASENRGIPIELANPMKARAVAEGQRQDRQGGRKDSGAPAADKPYRKVSRGRKGGERSAAAPEGEEQPGKGEDVGH